MLRIVLFCVASGLALAQIPRVGTIDFYGLRTLPEAKLRQALRISEGDRLPASKGEVEDRLETIPGIVLARLEAVCCTGERAILYVGIEERGAPHFAFSDPPSGNALLPEAISDTYHDYLRAFADAARAGETSEDISLGHPLAANPPVRGWQQKLAAIAAANLNLLREVLKTSDRPDQRAAAAAIIGYAPTKRLVVSDLQQAMRDPDETVRANAMRALGPIAALGAHDPDLGIRVEPTWFVELLNSIVWSDRYRAAQALVSITEKRPPELLAYLRERALASLEEMARWKTPAHAEPAFVLAGRIAGVPEAEIRSAWTRGDRESVLRRLPKA